MTLSSTATVATKLDGDSHNDVLGNDSRTDQMHWVPATSLEQRSVVVLQEQLPCTSTVIRQDDGRPETAREQKQNGASMFETNELRDKSPPTLKLLQVHSLDVSTS